MTMTLWGFDGSNYVRTVKLTFAEKQCTDYAQVPLNVLQGDPRTEEHLQRHPFGKVPVLDHDGLRIIETSAIVRYLNDVLSGPSLVPATPADRARMDMAIGVIDSYAYGAMLGVAGYHLFPDFVGGKNEAARTAGIETGRKAIEFAMTLRGDHPFIAGDISLADLFLAPVAAYFAKTPDASAVLDVPGFDDWWTRIRARPAFQPTRA